MTLSKEMAPVLFPVCLASTIAPFDFDSSSFSCCAAGSDESAARFCSGAVGDSAVD